MANPERIPTPSSPTPDHGWRRARVAPSLAEVYRSIPVSDGRWWRKILVFAGPGYLVAVGYMDPGNWATDLAAGSAYRLTPSLGLLRSRPMAGRAPSPSAPPRAR